MITAVERLATEGRSVAVFALPRTGASKALSRLRVPAARFYGMSSTTADVVGALEAIPADEAATVIIDGYGRRLMEPGGRDLDGILFETVFGSEPDPELGRSCVVGLRPVDPHDLPTSHVVERCVKLGYTVDVDQVLAQMVQAGYMPEDASALGREFSMWIGPLLAGATVANDRRSRVLSTAMDLLPETIGCLVPELQLRLAHVVERPDGARRAIDDSLLGPLVEIDQTRTRLAPWVRLTDYSSVVWGVTSAWPERNLSTSARRFQARIGPEPTPRWVDPFLGGWIEYLPRFLTYATSSPSCRSIELLSGEDAIRSVPVPKLRRALRDLGALSSGVTVDWRVASDRHVIHERQLHLPHLQRAWRVPPFDRLSGRHDVGNEVDAPLGSIPWSSVEQSWRQAQPVSVWLR